MPAPGRVTLFSDHLDARLSAAPLQIPLGHHHPQRIMSTMIHRIEGILEAVLPTSLLLQLPGGLVLEVLVSTYTAQRLASSIGQPVRLHTLLYLQSDHQGAMLVPHLLGFLSPEDRRFFELFTTCKGIGPRRALRAMSISTQQIAAAIADRDVHLLQSLPDIGKRTAETIIASLSGKVDEFLAPASAASSSESPSPPASLPPDRSLARQALDVLVQLGENRAQALAWIEQALASFDSPPSDLSELLNRVYQMKTP